MKIKEIKIDNKKLEAFLDAIFNDEDDEEVEDEVEDDEDDEEDSGNSKDLFDFLFNQRRKREHMIGLIKEGEEAIEVLTKADSHKFRHVIDAIMRTNEDIKEDLK